MMQTACNQMVGLIEQQLDNQFEIYERDGQCIVLTPMLYPDNSRISVALEAIDSQRFLLTDNGEASGYAFVHGVPDQIVQDHLRDTVLRFHLSDSGSDELMLRVEQPGIAKGIFTLVQAAQVVSYLVYHQSSVHS